jgi:hypothetical protein
MRPFTDTCLRNRRNRFLSPCHMQDTQSGTSNSSNSDSNTAPSQPFSTHANPIRVPVPVYHHEQDSTTLILSYGPENLFPASRSLLHAPLLEHGKENASSLCNPVHPLLLSSTNGLRCWLHGCNGRVFTSVDNYRRHCREQGQSCDELMCPICGRAFTRRTARDQHFTGKRRKAVDIDKNGIPFQRRVFPYPSNG